MQCHDIESLFNMLTEFDRDNIYEQLINGERLSKYSSVKISKYAGTDKVDLIENEEYGYCSLIKATNSVLDNQISDHFIKVVFPFAELQNTIMNDSGDEIGDDNGDVTGNDNSDELTVLKMLQEQPAITAREMCACSALSTRKISRIIKELRESEKITRIGSDRKGYWRINN